MVQSNFETKVEAAWPAIEAALQDGLKQGQGHELKTLVTIVDRPGDLAKHVTPSWRSILSTGSFTDERLNAHAGPVHQLRWTWDERLDDRNMNPTPDGSLEQLRQWARGSREGEYGWTLRSIAAVADVRVELNRQAVEHLEPGSRVVVFRKTGGDDLKKVCQDGGIELVEAILPDLPDKLVALAYPAGALAVARLQDLTPGFDYEPDNQSISIILSERIELIGFNDRAGARKYTRMGGFA